MAQSELINELAAALSKAQGEMQAAIKDKVNPFFKSSYADLGSVWDAARPVLSKYGLCVMQTTEMVADGSKIVMVTTLAHTSGQWMKSYLPLNPSKNDSQGIGSAITYLRRYSLSAIVGVVCDEDDDGEKAVGRGKAHENKHHLIQEEKMKQEKETQIEKIGLDEVLDLGNLIKNLDEESERAFFAWSEKTFGAKTLMEIPKSCFESCLIALNNKIKYLNDKNKEKVA